jgi:hypothetical protein
LEVALAEAVDPPPPVEEVLSDPEESQLAFSEPGELGLGGEEPATEVEESDPA